jgi:DNA-binding CsgD family transcriptional regulator
MREGSAREGAEGAVRPWGDIYRRLSGLPLDALAADDLERLATSAYLIGHDEAAVAAWQAAHLRHLGAGRGPEAARCAFWLAFGLMMQGQMAHASGWLSRAQTAIGESDCAAQGFVLVPAVLTALHSNDPATARDLAVDVTQIATRFNDADLSALGTLGHGQALIALGDPSAGLALLDSAMLSVEAGEVGPITSGVVYCAVVLECMALYDLRRAAEWTASLDRWCAAQTELVPYRGQCLVHQSQLQQAAGDWPQAAATVESACVRLRDPPHPALGLACYQEAELHRLVGDFGAATQAYERASRAGHQPMPGLALLELARGDVEAAAAGIGRALAETTVVYQRAPLLSAAVEIHRWSGDLAAARAAADELALIADRSTSEVLSSMAAQADGAVLLGAGEVSSGLRRLRAASEGWQRIGMPYEEARVAVLLGLGCLALGDEVSAALDFERAREAFKMLGARPDLERLRSLAGERGPRAGVGALSGREVEVLALVAAGRTNREVGDALTISQHTVGRHLENIFRKLGVSGRAAATAYAYEHGLL